MMEVYKKMPKVELHLHLDGSIPIEVLCNFSGLPREQVIEEVVSINDSSLSEYLKHFDFVNKYLQTRENIELASFELGKKLDEENVCYAEVRFAPLSHVVGGLTPEEVVESVLAGLRKCRVKTNLILCIRRGQDLETSLKVVNLVNKYLNKGVVALDLVGDEEHVSFKEMEYVFKVCKYASIPVTIHAGETTKRDILDVIPYTKRIGHGIKIYDDQELIDAVIKNNILLETCPNSNIDTKNVLDYSHHPIRSLYDKGVKISINTDNRTVSNINLTEEYENLDRFLGFQEEDFIKMNLNAIDFAFISDKEKEELKKIIKEKKS